jgi:hypothetical protein
VIGRSFVSDNLPLKLKVQVGLGYCDILQNTVVAGALKEVLTFVEKERAHHATRVLKLKHSSLKWERLSPTLQVE